MSINRMSKEDCARINDSYFGDVLCCKSDYL